MEAFTPAQLFGRQIAEVRRSLGLSQRDFARQVDERYGVSIDPATIARIEKANGKRVTLDEVFLLCAGLGISPLHVLAPREGPGELLIAETRYPARRARAWLRGEEALDERDEKPWQAGRLPDESYRHRRSELESEVTRLGARVRFLVSALERARAEWMDADSSRLQVQHEHEQGAVDNAEELASAELAMEAADQRHSTYEHELAAASTDHQVAQRELDALQRSMDEMGY